MRDWEKDWEICKKATAGKWEWVSAYIQNGLEVVVQQTALGSLDGHPVLMATTQFDTSTGEHIPYIDMRDEDAEFIAEAREALPYWLQRVRELEQENANLREQLKESERICFFCRAEMEEKLISTNVGWGDCKTTVNNVKAYVCPKCGEIVYPADEIHRLQEIGKRLIEESEGKEK